MQWQVRQILKSDTFGRIELLRGSDGARLLRRVACGASLPGSRLVARGLMHRERRALIALAGLPGVPELRELEAAALAPATSGHAPRSGDVLLREWIEGEPLHRAEVLADDFFDHLDALVSELHRCGVCHNDLHKEQNVMVGSDGFPHLIDFQLASLHPRGGRTFESRVLDDLRHVQKHRRRYTRDGRGPASAGVEHGRGRGLKRSPLALVWRRTGKPLYNLVTRGLLRTKDGEERRPSTGPWPRWVPARGERPGA
jgi:predicted Ser/Thr protein kinase